MKPLRKNVAEYLLILVMRYGANQKFKLQISVKKLWL